MKTCGICKEEKEASSFGKRAASNDGLAAKCKLCQKVYDKARDSQHHRIEARAIYAQTEEGKLAGNKAKSKYRNKNPVKAKAHAQVARAIRGGKLFKESCQICGSNDGIHAHHNDYAKPLNIRWLCSEHHNQWHTENGEGLNG